MIPPPDRSREPLLKTKLSPPQLRASLVSRTRLFNILAEGTQRALTLICAPAGYGKTTLLVDWLSAFQGVQFAGNPTVCWFSLDEGDNDPTRFLGYLISALENIDSQVGGEARSMLHSFPPPPLQTVLAVLVNNLRDLTRPICLVLDDYQFITNPTIHEGIRFFLDHAPAAVHLVIATRSDLPLPLARLRARDQLVELRADQLRFTDEEAAAFLDEVMSLSLSADDQAALENRTEGWIAGLQMAAIAIQSLTFRHGREDISDFIRAFSGSHRYILDYLAEEVLNRQPETVQHFLLTTSILDRLCGDLCDALLEFSIPSSQSILEYLDHANLFLVALDDERRWYRYHHLFADLLRARLYQSQPDMVPEFHRRASAWFDQNGFSSEAVQHALSAREFGRAAELIERHGTIRWSQGDPTLVTLASRLPLEILQNRPKLGICLSWMMITQGQSPTALQQLASLKDYLAADSSTESLWMSAFIDLLSNYGSLQSGANPQAALPDYKALELIPEQNTGVRETADFVYAILLNRQGDFVQAAEILDRCVRHEISANGPIAIFGVIALLARLRILQGRLPEAAALCQEYLKPVSAGQKRTLYAAGSLNIIFGEVLCEWNHLEEAEKQIREGILANEPWHNIAFDVIGYCDLVCVQMAKGELEEALKTMRHLEEMLQARTIPFDLEEELWTYRVRLWLAEGDLASADEWAERMPATDPQDFLQEWGRISFARVRLAQGRISEAQGVLEALKRLPGAAKRIHRQIRVDLLMAIVLSYKNRMPQAFEALEACLGLAEKGGYLRVFLDSGEPVRTLLAAYLRTPAPALKAYAQKLLEAFTQTKTTNPPSLRQGVPIESLTPREAEVLGLLAKGCSNRQIAEKLILAEGTVKFYVHVILEKFDVHSRTQAIAKAKEINLI